MTAVEQRVAPERTEEFTQPGPLLATWWRQKTPGSYYWRTLLPARHLPGQTLRFLETDAQDSDPDGADSEIVFPRLQGASVWQFAGNATGGTLLRAMQLEGHRVMMEVDDNYLVAPDVGIGHGDWQTDLDRSGQTDRHSYAAHRRISGFVDGVIVSTPELEAAYSAVNANVYVCPNSVDPDDWPTPDKPDDGILRIGWAASHSHIVDAPLVRRALAWAAEQRGVEVYVYGIGEVVRFPGAVKRVPWTDTLSQYRASLGRLDVQVCPLIETPWSRGKSDVKALEAAMAGSWPIVSSAAPYRPWHDRTLVCTTRNDWLAALRWAVGHRDEIAGLAAEAREYVLGKRQIRDAVRLWREAVVG